VDTFQFNGDGPAAMVLINAAAPGRLTPIGPPPGERRRYAGRLLIPPRTISASVMSRGESARATWCGVLPVTPECSLMVPRFVSVDAPDPVVEGGLVSARPADHPGSVRLRLMTAAGRRIGTLNHSR
jgi:hypothetical protein